MSRDATRRLTLAAFLLCSISLWTKGSVETDAIAAKENTPAKNGFSEAPILAELVREGKLPPIEKRIPKNPSTIAPLENIGQYGGTIRVFHRSDGPWEDFGDLTERGPTILRIDESGNVVGDMAESYELSANSMSITIRLREGLRWSDGQPFTADDLAFTWNDMHGHPLVPMWNFLGPVKDATKIDDYTFRMELEKPSPNAEYLLCGPGGGSWGFYQPFHYLKQWHVDYNPDADRKAKEEGFEGWDDALYSHYWWVPLKDLDLPTMQPWLLSQSSSSLKAYDRNPYYHAVDTAGNQYPYIDQIIAQIVEPETYKLKVISGESDAAFIFTNLADYTLYKENETEGNYFVFALPGLTSSEAGIALNFSHPDPIKRALFSDLRFRRALSHAIDREEINKVVYHGMAVARQPTVLPGVSYFKKEWEEMYADYDPKLANKLLDEVGLDKKNRDGFRLRSDGKVMEIVLMYTSRLEGTGISRSMELVREYWEAAGIRTIASPQSGSLLEERKGSDSLDVCIGQIDSMAEFPNQPVSVRQVSSAWSLWIGAQREIEAGEKTLEDFESGKLPGEEPPQWAKDYESWICQRSFLSIDSEEYRDLSAKIYDLAAAKLLVIGLVGMVPTLFVAKNTLGNVPKAFPPLSSWVGNLNKLAYQMYLKQD